MSDKSLTLWNRHRLELAFWLNSEIDKETGHFKFYSEKLKDWIFICSSSGMWVSDFNSKDTSIHDQELVDLCKQHIKTFQERLEQIILEDTDD